MASTQEIPGEAIRSAAAWAGPALAQTPSWIVPLTADERAELRSALKQLRAQGLADDAPRPPLVTLQPTLRRWRDALRDGVGFVLVRGVPIEDCTRDEAAALFGLLGRALGDAVPQNGAGELICDVRDTGADPTDPHTRLYTTRAEQDFHTDGADVIGLLALVGGERRDPRRRLRARRPDLVPLLFDEWCFHLHGSFPPGFPAYFRMPICRWDGAHLATFFLGWYIRRAQALPEVPPLTDTQREVLALFEETANDPALYLDMQFEPGDIQWLKNSVILHKRTAYEDFDEPARKRHLLRLWLTARDFADGDERLRSGLTPEVLR